MAEPNNATNIYASIFSVVLWVAISIAMIVIGSMHVGDCQREPNIPIYLIVAGAAHLLAFCLIPLKKSAEKVAIALETIVALFTSCWFITGSVWVFRIYPENPRNCNNQVYNFAFGILIFEYIFIAVVLLFICLCACCAGLNVARSNSQANLSNE